MQETIPLFPLGSTVLFPGALLPLHIFEPRYRRLVRDLLGFPEGRQRHFGVVAIRQGWEVGGPDNVQALHTVGCTARVRRINPHPDGRYDVIGVGTHRFELLDVDDSSKPYLCGRVRWLLEDEAAADGGGDDAEAAILAKRVGALFAHYAGSVAQLQGSEPEGFDLPNDPVVLSYLVAATALLTLDDRQGLLAESSTVTRLQMQARLLRREATIVRALHAVPVPLIELAVPRSVN
ncbi:MAG: LON peptidase substrate-binding domain-containing protein [Geodermatophilaceae bacterium]|nr:LON peptidase substrate-binding domain-containing protein [Geodermatophilaceae bacterium]